MNYGVDPHHPDLLGQIEATLAALTEKHPDLITTLLINGTFDDELASEFFMQSKGLRTGVVSLYENSVLSGLEECAPFLLTAEMTRLPRLLARSQGVPMFSLLQSTLTIHALQRHFSAFLQVRTPSDGLCFPLRFSDAMCSQNILRCLNDAQRIKFCSGFTAWHLVNRGGTLTTIEGTCFNATSYTPPIVSADNAIDITDKQYARLIHGGEAAYLLCHFARTVPALVTGAPLSIKYTMITSMLAAMDRRDIMDDTERRDLLSHALRMSDRERAVAMLDAAQQHGTKIAIQRFT
ncbi:DUF4123 domain-containing protein [Glaciimonas immobilis]|uniref:DUF4123 domain-containing protein n=1 Tax=Glaciimonas immobilis TaxID=728004 RepID=A0A840RW62_9BURK|nr:DUF4123 domain-containing protein [Glaciimonas immobilis]KAF3996742.1 DUF4123 domain-containing protein [Glaciimonas immobilis]MBB5201338.1 hypothetical protein [Glaciimonas immobilis]